MPYTWKDAVDTLPQSWDSYQGVLPDEKAISNPAMTTKKPQMAKSQTLSPSELEAPSPGTRWLSDVRSV